MDHRECVLSAISEVNPLVDIHAIDENMNLLEAGIVDSVQFLEIVSLLEQEYKREIDFLSIDAAKMTSISGLIKTFSATAK